MVIFCHLLALDNNVFSCCTGQEVECHAIGMIHDRHEKKILRKSHISDGWFP